ncbi:transposase [bacterium]|nr:transposase [bacterium]
MRNISYSESNAYFLTLVAHNRQCLFAEITNAEWILKPIGEVIREEWLRCAEMRPAVELGEFVVMPNHLHGIVYLLNAESQSARSAALQVNLHDQPHRTSVDRAPKSISSMVAGFKAATTRKIREQLRDPGFVVWQPRFHDRVIRDDKEFRNIRAYIRDNPRRWHLDNENPERHP